MTSNGSLHDQLTKPVELSFTSVAHRVQSELGFTLRANIVVGLRNKKLHNKQILYDKKGGGGGMYDSSPSGPHQILLVVHISYRIEFNISVVYLFYSSFGIDF